ncbi:hypothetical protein Rsub_05388 [Raphidocelis subcapitata]|uniref:ERD4-related membrane protein n=1 Tax=Raphidocelis subcapitata TaxID=307507 RepID=A0A2V0NZM0_9CHLO|nr:hypothetical protein Rsub_05388 [Raphidocelis subcapitata]|eukprot:GBF92769.1 hypothetical protein Rsub_05388 [Raphidocelis subcapitata]
MPVDARTVGVTLGLNLAITLGLFGLFSLLRVARWSRRWYAPSRFRTAADAADAAVGAGHPGHPPPGTPQPPALPLTLLTWLWPLLRLSEEDVLRVTGGLDVAMYLRIIRFGLALTASCIVWCIGVVLPVNFTGGALDDILAATGAGADEEPPVIQLGPGKSIDSLASEIANNTYVFSSLDKLSMANVPAGSPRLWVHLASVWVVSLIAMRLLWRYSTEAVELRYRYLAQSSPGCASRTVLVTDIPGPPDGTLLNRAFSIVNGVVGWLLPPFVKHRVRAAWEAAFGIIQIAKSASLQELASGAGGADPCPAVRAHPLLLGAVSGGGGGGGSERLSIEGSEAGASGLFKARPGEALAAAGGQSDQGGWESDGGGSAAAAAPPPAGEGAGPLLEAGEEGGDGGDGAGGASEAARARAAPRPKRPSPYEAAAIEAAAAAAGARQLTPDSGTALLVGVAAGGGGGSGGGGAAGAAQGSGGGGGGGGRRRPRLEALGRIVGGVLRRHGEWRRAHQRLASGLSLEELVRVEFQEVYGAATVAAVLPAVHTRGLEAAAAAYARAKMLLEARLCRFLGPVDQLDQVELQLERAEQKARRRRAAAAASSAAAPTPRAARRAASAAARASRRLLVPAAAKRLTNTVPGTWAFQKYGRGVKAVDLLQYQLDWLREAHVRLKAARAAALERPLPSAFVTFNTRWPAVVAATSLHTHDELVWRLRPAPNPDEVIWRALRLRLWERSMRRFLVVALLAVLALFYVVPVAALQGVLQLDRLRELPFLATLLDLPVVHSLLLGLLPGLALRLWLLLLPAALYPLSRAGGALSWADVDFQVSTQYFTFQVLATFGASFISGTLFSQIQQLVENPQQVLVILGTGVPQTAAFFILYILFVGLIGRSLGLLRIWGLLVFAVRSAFARTPRARARTWQLQACAFGPRIPDQTIIMLLGLVFCVIQPLLLVATLIFFAVSLPVEKYNLVYVFRRQFESGGRMWQQVFNQIMTGVYTMQVVMLSLLSIKRFVYSPLLLPLMLGTLLFHRSAHALFERPWETLSLRDARDLDEAETQGVSTPLLAGGGGGGGGDDGGDDDDAAPGGEASAAVSRALAGPALAIAARQQYLPPSFWPREREVAQLASEVARLRAARDAHNAAVGAGAEAEAAAAEAAEAAEAAARGAQPEAEAV